MTKDKVIVALDVKTFEEAKQLIDPLWEVIRTFKVGSGLFTACGPEVIKYIHQKNGRVFLDLKFHDIPNTVASAIQSAASLGVFMCNVHASGGKRMMEAAKQALPQSGAQPLLLAVTVLTSMEQEDLVELGLSVNPAEQVVRLAQLAKEAGLDGVVASGEEVDKIRKACGQDVVIVVPGVRPEGSAKGDQRRVVTPKEAFARGADFIVVGRPITQDPNPREAAERIVLQLKPEAA